MEKVNYEIAIKFGVTDDVILNADTRNLVAEETKQTLVY
jgi:hypothetical protein